MEDIQQFLPEDQQVTVLRRRLKAWFRKHGRSLPWRETRDPYQIWVSEIMLQQTTVKAVVPYFERFLARFPQVEALAAASEEEVLQAWEGLGYYSRGRNLRQAAVEICERFHGEFPKGLDDLQSLPGIGRYTAGAIRSFAFDLPAPIVEANTLRLYCRLLGYDGDPRDRTGERLLWSFAERLQPQRNAGELNQALMELGSQVCTPASPLCDQCPVSSHCRAFADSSQNSIPWKRERPKVTQLVEASVAIRSGETYLVRQRQSDKRWAGMWDFPRFGIADISSRTRMTRQGLKKLSATVRDELVRTLQVEVENLELVTEIRHSVTRYRIRLLCLRCDFTHEMETADSTRSSGGEIAWKTLRELEELPMPRTGRQFENILSGKQS
ncbi:putative A/G-specific adenine glycosylase YfhQ [Thalassoglobus neptunius]|uniref:Adenine DNA glycosylase n=1 Tax=Thalassoglobus neptunius TaxID=1938619 RepID=A0A5C5X5S3_9PLAN|nr:A/G-specific adenine glycosylase [Thalassoglobus neptunius]TWT57362.1 putative A/G-specific adenine glycosylase YfhQ [Thalassoglobus neptunius]